jgi:hypothetical protein
MPTLNDAVAAIKAGRCAEGRSMLSQVLLIDPNNVNALLWMTEVAETIEERRSLLKRILVVDPNNAVAQKGLAVLGPAQKSETSQQDTSPTPAVKLHEISSASEPTIPSIVEATRKCPYCAELVRAEAAVCRYCGRSLNDASSSTKPLYSAGKRILLGVVLMILMYVAYQLLMNIIESNRRAEIALSGYAAEPSGVMTFFRLCIIGCGVFGLVMTLSGLFSELNKVK